MGEEMRGVFVSEHCPRGRKDCSSLAQIISSCGGSFVCCGHNDGTTREIEQDRFRVCFKNDSTDTLLDYDEQDMMDEISVLSQAMSIDNHIRLNKKED